MEFSIGIWRFYDLAVKALNFAAVETSLEQFSKHIRNCICNFQLRYTNYQFESSRLHKNFKDSFNKKEDENITYTSYITMIDFLERGMNTLCSDIVKEIREYFSLTHKHRTAPIVSIYLVDENDKLVSIAKYPKLDSNFQPTEIEKNTCFSYICANGTSYLANNLPKTAKKTRSFLHEGLNVDEVKKKYRLKFIDKKIISRFYNNFIRESKLDNEWLEVSNDQNTNKFSSKSHLVVPITFRMHADQSKLSNKMIETLKLREDGRSILGFICINHLSTYYFDNGNTDSYENIDVNIMYLFADMISLILVTFLMYKDGSKTTNSYLNCNRSLSTG